MEEAYWKQFMTTGKVTDYLQFKGMAECKEGLEQKETKEGEGELPDAGFGKGNSSGA